MLITVENINDPRLDGYRNLTRGRLLRDSFFIAEGTLLVERLIASPYPTESIVTTRAVAERLLSQVECDVPIYVVTNQEIRALVGFDFHRGVLACGHRLPSPDLTSVLDDTHDTLTVVLLPHIHDQVNLGGILRVCGAFGVDAVVLGPRCADYLGRRALRVSMGSALQVPTIQVESVVDAMLFLRKSHVEIAATVLDATAEKLDEAVRPGRFGIVFGPEDHGLDADLLCHCERRITVPMQCDTDSLNVAVAAGIFLYHLNGTRVQN